MNTQYLGARLVSSEMSNGTRVFAKRSRATTPESREFIAGKAAVMEGITLLSRLFMAWAGMGLMIGLLIVVSAV
ncbi:MAG TPA: hypothetical protein VI457_00525 [Methylococcaceae bacterium]|nr:hypothetical protein [Methylococcaceae bacterium]